MTVVAIVIAGIALAVSVAPVREHQKQILIHTFVEYNRRYAEVMEKLPQELFFSDYRRMGIDEFCEALVTEDVIQGMSMINYRKVLWDKIFRYFDLCYEEYQLNKLGKGWLIPRRWTEMFYIWDKGIWQNTNSMPIHSVFKRYLDMHDRGKSGRYTSDFIEYMDGIIKLRDEPDSDNWDKRKRKPK